MLRRRIDHCESLAFLATQVGISVRSAYKLLARYRSGGAAALVDRRQGSSRGAGYEKAHVAIDDATRLAYVEVLPDKKQATTVGFLLRAVAWFDGQGISGRRVLSDNGSAYRSKPWREACSALGLISKRTRP